MRPAKGQHHRTIVAITLQCLEATIAIHLQYTAKTSQMRARVFRAAITRIHIGYRRRAVALLGAIINRIGP